MGIANPKIIPLNVRPLLYGLVSLTAGSLTWRKNSESVNPLFFYKARKQFFSRSQGKQTILLTARRHPLAGARLSAPADEALPRVCATGQRLLKCLQGRRPCGFLWQDMTPDWLSLCACYATRNSPVVLSVWWVSLYHVFCVFCLKANVMVQRINGITFNDKRTKFQRVTDRKSNGINQVSSCSSVQSAWIQDTCIRCVVSV